MGLDISHDAFSGAYSAFNSFRRFVAKSIGGSFPPHDNDELDGRLIYFGDGYDSSTHLGLTEFLGHSDCDGEIDSQMCKVVADELESIMPQIEKLAETEQSHGHIKGSGGYVQVTRNFIDGCRLAHRNNEPLEFL